MSLYTLLSNEEQKVVDALREKAGIADVDEGGENVRRKEEVREVTQEDIIARSVYAVCLLLGNDLEFADGIVERIRGGISWTSEGS